MSSLPHDDLGDAWRAARVRPAGVHLDHAACSRQSTEVLDAVARHARHEAELGGYVAEQAAEGLLQQGRSVLAGLVGMAAADVAFTESATTAVQTLFSRWRLPAGSRIGVLPGEYFLNEAAIRAAGFVPTTLPADPMGRADVAGIERMLREDPPAVVHLTVVASHRGLVQPAAEVSALCRAAGVPLVLDVAQALGQVDCDVAADAAYGTSRKWLAGPRGVGFLVLRPTLSAQLAPVVGPELFDAAGDTRHTYWYESHEAHVAGRVGLVVAVGEHLAAGPQRVRARLAALGRATRERLDGRGGWQVAEPLDEPTAITTLRAPDGVDVREVVARLRTEHGLLTTAAGRERAPRELAGPVLRVSPHLDSTVEQLDLLATALAH
ncbi:ergothioneine biosynthesis PLP-dependent enzyme EgtE [Modestobacter sp. VKM Ac-2979]|uniref:ergothioneine biosynthesis PLP-dependent enzyme EgtE n=1 Tax=unclassified Modestobacter TaxID=2643866 RepID=UPI0022AB53D8|nr:MULTISPECIES: ergothioneine biosynthesis PLP-dependent enzyme EgtE [unclassified Modestobacter]MCZ2813217.1 ergothioneine biosynthesis PLP-dependent enzyme EgtE [Modestobacter sp. VKM Ac-2979]MCZ2844833.1 ergothioneine biosynthesis PLP-dependent enzyme EgtE [Modestobacter sp. VKM Ac-2980]